MTAVAHRPMAIALAALAMLAGTAAAARVARADVAPPSTDTMTQEWVGLELTPVSLSFAGTPCCGREGGVQTLQAGPGAGVRLLRHRWQHVYFNPILAGVYVSSGHRTVFVHLETEGGVIVPGTDRRLELGVGVGLGILSMHYADGCDGSCVVGGTGALVSFAARYSFVDRPKFSIGASTRVVIPLQTPSGDSWGYFVADGQMILGSIEVAFGHG